MSSPSARIRLTIGAYLWKHGHPAHKRYGADAAAAALEWSRELFAAPRGEYSRRFHDAFRALSTAAELGVASGQKPLIAEVCQATVDLMTEAATRNDTETASFALDVVTEMRARFTDEQRRIICESLTSLHNAALALVTPLNPPYLAGRLLELRRILFQTSSNPDEALRCDREHAALLAEHAADRADALVEAAFLEDAITLAVRGNEDNVVINEYRVRRRDALTRGTATMKPIRTIVQVPEEMAEAIRRESSRMVDLPLAEFVFAFALASRPTLTIVRASVEAAATSAPLSQIFGRVIITSPGETVALGSNASDLEFEHGVLMLQLGAARHLVPIWKARQERGDLTVEALLDSLRASGNFQEDALDTIADGLDDAFAGRTTSAIHLLVPQLEDVLRRILQMSGHDPGKQNRSDLSVTEEMTLGGILQALESESVITPDDAFLFHLVLDDPRGLNLRNRTGHGLMRRTSCSPEALTCVLQCYAVVASLPPRH